MTVPETYSFVQEEVVSCQVVRAQQPPQDADGGFKQIHIHILVEGKLFLDPALCFGEFCAKKGKLQQIIMITLHPA